MDELSKKWEDLSDIAQATIIELVAGKHQGNVFASLMSNFDVARSALETSINSSGSAMTEHAKWSESLEARLNKLKSAWQSLSQSFMSSDFLKGVLDVIIDLVNWANKLIDTFGTIPTLLGLFAGGMSPFNKKGIFSFDKDSKSLQIFKKNISDLKTDFGKLQVAVDRYNSASSKSVSFQEKYNKAMSNSSSSIGKYLSGLNGAKASIGGYITHLAGAAIKTVALEAATMALNAALTMGVSALISAGIKLLDEWIVTADELADKVDEVVSKFNDQQGELVKGKSSFESQANRYGELAKGVDRLGRNMSLTADEYSEYQNISNSIADQIPSLVSGFDKQGNAILNYKGNVEELTKAYENLIKAQNNEVLMNAGDIDKDFENVVKDAKKFSGFLGFGTKLSTGSAKVFKDILNSEHTSTDIDNAIGSKIFSYDLSALSKKLKDADFKRKSGETDTDYIKRAFKENKEVVKRVLDDFYADLEKETAGKKSLAKAVLSNAFDISSSDYYEMNDTLKGVAKQIVSGFDYEFFAGLESKGTSVETYINNMLDKLNAIGKDDVKSIEAAFDLQTKFNGGDISYGEYVKGVQDAGKLIDTLNLEPEVESQIKLNLGLIEEDGKWVVEEYENLLSRLTSKEYEIQLDTDSAKSFLDGLNSQELNVAVNFLEEGNEDFNAALQNYKNVFKDAEKAGVDFSKTVYGNIDTNARQVLEWNSENLEKYKEQLMSFEPEDAKWDDVKKEYENTISTVMGAWDTFEIDGKKVNIAFSPMLQTDNGAEVLSSPTVNSYIGKLIEKATEDGKWNNEELFKLDAEGIEVEGQKISGILADIGKNAEKTAEQMHFVGEDGALALAESEMMAIVERQAKVNEAMNFTMPIKVELEWAENFKTILEESNSAVGLTTESIESLTNRYKDLEEFDAEKLFMRTAQGVKINTDAVDELESAIEKQNKAQADSHLKTLEDEYARLTEEIENAGSAAERANLYAKRDDVVEQIKEISTLKSQYEGLTSAYNDWLNAQDVADKGDTHGQVMTMMESAEELKKGGYVGTNEFKSAAQFLSYDDLSTADIDTIVDKWVKGKKKFDKYFTEDESGAEKFLNDLNGINKEWAKIEDGEWKVDVDIDKAAEEMGVSTSFIMAMLDELEARGIKINYEDDGLEKFKTHAEEAQEAYNKIMGENGEKKIEFKFGTGNIKTVNSQLDEAKLLYDTITTKDGKVNLDAEGAEQVRTIILDLIQEKQQLEKPAIMDIKVDGDSAKSDIGKATKAVQDLQNNLWRLEQSTYDPSINSAEIQAEISKIIGSLNTLEKSDPEIYAKLGLDESQITNLKTAISNIQADVKAGVEPNQEDIATVQSTIKGIDATVVANVLTGEVSGTTGTATITPKPSTTDLGDGFTGNGTIAVSPDKLDLGTDFVGKATIDVSPNKTDFGNVFSGTAKITPSLTQTHFTVTVGTGEADGTAHVNGTAFANGTVGRAFKQGDWSIKDSGIALGGELGQELVVRDGKYFTIGDKGAEFFHYKAGDIIFNAGQTKQLFEQGKITNGQTRGRALAEGTIPSNGKAFAYTGGGGGKLYGGTYTSSSSSNSSSKKSSSSSSSDDFEETLDWIETKINRIERAIDQLDTKASSTYRSWSERNKALASEISKVGDEISLQQKAYDRYMQEANSVGLSESWAKLVRDGAIDIDTITDEKLADKIKEYTEWYDKALDCKDAILELQEAESELYAQRFENVSKQYDGILQGFEHTENMLNEYISQAEEQGHIVSKKYYEALIDNEKSNIAELKKEQADLIASRDEAVDSGTIIKGSEEWYNMCAEIDGVTQAIEESTTALLEYDNAMHDIDWEVFDLIQERISDVTDEAEFLIDLMSNDKLFDDNGRLTSQGLATMGLHAQNYNTHMYQADEYGVEVAKLNKEIANDPYDQELINRRNEILELQRESILAAEDEKEAIRDMVEEGIELELDALQERIDKYNEALDSQKDLYDYQKKVKEQTEEIASLEKQMAAYSGDDSEEAKQKIQQIKVDLESAREDLQETEYDKYISDQQQLLDVLYGEYELILNQRLDNVDYLLEQVVESINAVAGADSEVMSALGAEGAISVAINDNATSIKTTLENETRNVGTTLSNAMNQIWSVGEGNAKSVLTMYGEDFRTKSTTINTTLNGIKTSVNNVVNALNKEATKKVTANKTTTSAKKDPTKDKTNTKKTTTKTKKSSGDGKPKIGDKVTFVSGQYYYDSQGKKPLGSKYKGKQVYITNINTRDWATHGYHISTGKKLGDGDLGWLKLNQISGYASGKKNFLDDEVAWTQENGTEFIVRPSDGAILTPITRKGSVLNAQASNNLWDMTNSPAEFIRDNLNLGAADIPNNSSVQNSYVQNLDKVVFNLPNIKNYDEFLAAMQKDKNFERLVTAMTIDRIAGKSSLAKNKSIR